MPVLHPAEIWQQSGRWDGIGRDVPAEGPLRPRHVSRDDPRRGRGVARRPRDPLVPRLAADLVPDPDQGTGRGPPALRGPSDARVPDEGFLHARPRCRGARGVLQRPQGRLLPDLRSVRPPVCRRAVGSRHDGRLRLARVHGPERRRGGRRRPVRRVRICRQCRAGPRRALDTRRSRLGARRGGDPRRPYHRGRVGIPRDRSRPHRQVARVHRRRRGPPRAGARRPRPARAQARPRAQARGAPRARRGDRGCTWASRPARWDRLARAG